MNKLGELFWKKGYLVIDKFFDDDLMDYLNNSMINHFGHHPDWEHDQDFLKKTKTEVIPWFPFREGNTDFQSIEDNKGLNDLTDEILGTGWKQLYLMAMFSKKGTKGQAWHQDCPPENIKHFNLNRLFYTHDITDATGGKTVVMPGSHLMGELTVGDPHENLKNQVTITPKKGTLVFLHGHLWHRVERVKGSYRVSVNSRAIPKDTPEDITDIAVYRNLRYRFSTNEIIEERK